MLWNTSLRLHSQVQIKTMHSVGSKDEKKAEYSSTNVDREKLKLAARSMSTAIVMQAKEIMRPQKALKAGTRDLNGRMISLSNTPNKKRRQSGRGSLDLP